MNTPIGIFFGLCVLLAACDALGDPAVDGTELFVRDERPAGVDPGGRRSDGGPFKEDGPKASVLEDQRQTDERAPVCADRCGSRRRGWASTGRLSGRVQRRKECASQGGAPSAAASTGRCRSESS